MEFNARRNDYIFVRNVPVDDNIWTLIHYKIIRHRDTEEPSHKYGHLEVGCITYIFESDNIC